MAGDIELMPGERIVVEARPHWWFFWKQLFEGIGVVILAALTLAFGGTLGTIFTVLTVLALLSWVGHSIYQFIQWRTTHFAVTSRRVAYRSGFFHRRGVSIPLDRINNVNFEQSLIARMLNNGILTIESAGDTGDSVFENIANPNRVRSVIFQEIEQLKTTDAQRTADAVSGAMSAQPAGNTANSPSVSQRLAELESLRTQNVLTDAEYTAKREAILGDL